MEDKKIIDVIYKDIQINYNEEYEIWECDIANAHFQKQTLKECKKRIDDFFKKEFKRIKIFRICFEGFKKGEITSLIENERYADCWIIDENKNRSKEKFECLYFDNEYNNKLLEEYNKQKEIIKKEEDKLKEILGKFQKFNLEINLI